MLYHTPERLMKTCLLLIAISLFLPMLCPGQPVEFAHLNVEQGLSSKSVLSIAQDSRGFMWFGTADGLNRYDSRSFVTYYNNTGRIKNLPSSYILSLLSDSMNNLWVGTTMGLARYLPAQDNFESIQLPKQLTGNARGINCIYEDRNKVLWIGSTEGLFFSEDGGKTFSALYETPGGIAGNMIRAVLQDAGGHVWVGTDKGLTRITREGGRFVFETYRHRNNDAGSLLDDAVAALAEDEQHRLWIGLQQKGIELFDAATHRFTPYASAPVAIGNIRKMVADQKEHLWIGTQDGLVCFDMARNRFTAYQHDPENSKSLSQNSIYSLFIDQCQSIWIGTYFGGINRVHKPMFTVHKAGRSQQTVNSGIISSIVEDRQGNLWIGTEGGGLNYFDRQNNRFTAYRNKAGDTLSLSSNLVKVVYKDKEENIWIGTHGAALNVLPYGQSSVIRHPYLLSDKPNVEILALAEDNQGRFWMGSNAGLRVFKKNHLQLTPVVMAGLPENLQKQLVDCFCLDAQNNLWIGGWGLFVMKDGAGSITPFHATGKEAALLNATRINCIREDKEGRLWIGSDRDGLFCYEPRSGNIFHYTTSEGLANNRVYGIVQDERGDVWISTGNGLSRLIAGKNSFHNYTVADGLAGNEFNMNSYAQTSSGELLFGGFNGFTSFYPAAIEENNYQPRTFITGLSLFNQPVQLDDESGILHTNINFHPNIELKYRQNVFTIHFAVLNYIKADKNRYAYKMEAIDKDWNYTSLPSATYNNLPPGSYTFLAKGANNDGRWSQPVALHIRVLRPWYRSWWAYSLYALLLAGIVFLVIRFFFLQALMKRDKELTALKLNFFTNISHEIRTYLSLIAGPVEKLLMQKKEDDPDVPSLHTIKNNSDDLLRLVNELLDFRKAETGNLTLHVSENNVVPFVQSVYQSFRDIALSKNIVTDFSSGGEDTIDVYFDKEQMKKVLFNLMANAYKFTPDGGLVSLSIENRPDAIAIRVADNGKGISPENITRLFDNYFQEKDEEHQNTGYGIGLALSKSIVALHNGSLFVESKPADEQAVYHTCFTVVLKKGTAHFNTSHVVITTGPETRLNESGTAEKNNRAVYAGNELSLALPGSKQYSILVVEDNQQVRQFITGSLSHVYQLSEAVNGAEGLRMAVDLMPDLIISDVMMPEMDGYAFCEQIKTDVRTSHIPVILLTARSSVNDHISGLQTGADTYLTKPFSIQVLSLQVQNLIATSEKIRQQYSRQFTGSESATAHQAVPEQQPVNALDDAFIRQLKQLAEENISNPDFDVEMISRKMAMSQSVLYKKVKALTGLRVNDIVKNVRLKKAAELIAENKYAVYEVADMVGYSDTKYFSKEFKKYFGKTPSEYLAE